MTKRADNAADRPVLVLPEEPASTLHSALELLFVAVLLVFGSMVCVGSLVHGGWFAGILVAGFFGLLLIPMGRRIRGRLRQRADEELRLWPDRIDHVCGEEQRIYAFDDIAGFRHKRTSQNEGPDFHELILWMRDGRRLILSSERWPFGRIRNYLRERIVPWLRNDYREVIRRGETLAFRGVSWRRVAGMVILIAGGLLGFVCVFGGVGILIEKGDGDPLAVGLILCLLPLLGRSWVQRGLGVMLNGRGVRYAWNRKSGVTWSEVACVYRQSFPVREKIHLLDDRGRERMTLRCELREFPVLRALLRDLLPPDTPWYEVKWWQVGWIGRLVELLDRLRGTDADHASNPSSIGR